MGSVEKLLREAEPFGLGLDERHAIFEAWFQTSHMADGFEWETLDEALSTLSATNRGTLSEAIEAAAELEE